jgi:septal ring factor EnvC (AmiA/AmiB activator)
VSEAALADAIAALAKSQLLTVDVLRQTQATTEAMARTLGRICDQNAEILKQVEQSNNRHADSERNIRVVKTELEDVKRRLAPIEATLRKAGGKQ